MIIEISSCEDFENNTFITELISLAKARIWRYFPYKLTVQFSFSKKKILIEYKTEIIL